MARGVGGWEDGGAGLAEMQLLAVSHQTNIDVKVCY